jgi:type II secretory pathway predicted ATPase ExeA
VYEAHFGLKKRPFGETQSHAAYVTLPSHDAVLRRLRYALEYSHGSAVLYGPSGSGKTILARRLANDLGWRAVHMTFPVLPATDLLAYLAEEFLGVTTPPRALSESLRQLRQHLAAMAQRHEHSLVIIDDAHFINSVATYEALQLLLNFASNGPPDLSLLFVGGAEVLLELPSSLADRLAARCLLGPLTEAESSAYVLGRAAAAGAKHPLFSPMALNLLHRSASGLPRRLNHLADIALLIAYARDVAVADDLAVASATSEFGHEIAA